MDTTALIPTATDLSLLSCLLYDKTLYAHLTTDIPNVSDELVSQLNVASGGNYTPLELNNLQVLQAGAGAIVVADPISWIGLTVSAPLAAIAFCLQAGVSPSNSDSLFSVLAFVDSAGLPRLYNPDGRNFSVDLTETPIFKTRSS